MTEFEKQIRRQARKNAGIGMTGIIPASKAAVFEEEYNTLLRAKGTVVNKKTKTISVNRCWQMDLFFVHFRFNNIFSYKFSIFICIIII